MQNILIDIEEKIEQMKGRLGLILKNFKVNGQENPRIVESKMPTLRYTPELCSDSFQTSHNPSIAAPLQTQEQQQPSDRLS